MHLNHIIKVCFILIISCNNVSTNDLASEVENSIIEGWTRVISNHPEIGIEAFDIYEFGLVYQEKTYYKGLLSGRFYYDDNSSEDFNFTIDVTYDGKHFIWEIPAILYWNY